MSKAISLQGMFDAVGYAPHQMQRRVHAAARGSRFRVVCAGRRTGKSTLGGHEITPLAMQAYFRHAELDPHERRMEYWIIGPEYSDAEKEFRVVWNDLKKLEFKLDKPGSYNDPIGGSMHISLFGGRFLVHAKSAKYPDTLVGEGLDGVILAEAAKLKPSVWNKFIRPTLADKRGWALLTSTPEGKNWFYEMWQRGQSEQKNWWSIRMPSWSNDIVFPGGRLDEEILDMEAGMTVEKFKQEVGAEFTEFVGRVFKDFDEEYHVGNYPYNPRWPVYMATDYGWTNPSVALFIQMDIWNNIWVCGEYYRTHKTPDEMCDDILADPRLARMAEAATQLYPDPASPADSHILENRLRLKAQGGTGIEIKDRVNLIRRALKVKPEFAHLQEGDPARIPGIHWDRSCVKSIAENQDYRYPENKTEMTNDKENPLKKDDHTPEALGRWFAGYFGTFGDTGRPVVRTARTAPRPRRGRLATR